MNYLAISWRGGAVATASAPPRGQAGRALVPLLLREAGGVEQLLLPHRPSSPKKFLGASIPRAPKKNFLKIPRLEKFFYIDYSTLLCFLPIRLGIAARSIAKSLCKGDWQTKKLDALVQIQHSLPQPGSLIDIPHLLV